MIRLGFALEKALQKEVSALCDFEKRVAKCVANFSGIGVKLYQHRERRIFIYHYAEYRYRNMRKVV